jgi:hypothetical protein
MSEARRGFCISGYKISSADGTIAVQSFGRAESNPGRCFKSKALAQRSRYKAKTEPENISRYRIYQADRCAYPGASVNFKLNRKQAIPQKL